MNPSIDVWRDAILFIIALVLSVTVHEFGHAWAASRLGDSVPRAQGRLTLNPLRHIDPMGTLLFPLLMTVWHIPILGWGRPVSTNPSNYTRRLSRPTGSMLVALAGPAMNLVMAALVSVIIVVGRRLGYMDVDTAMALVKYLIALNLTLLFFNLLPIPPLDGGAVLAWVLPRSMQGAVEFLGRWGFLILLGLMMTPVLGWAMAPGYYIARMWIAAVLGASNVDLGAAGA